MECTWLHATAGTPHFAPTIADAAAQQLDVSYSKYSHSAPLKLMQHTCASLDAPAGEWSAAAEEGEVVPEASGSLTSKGTPAWACMLMAWPLPGADSAAWSSTAPVLIFSVEAIICNSNQAILSVSQPGAVVSGR